MKTKLLLLLFCFSVLGAMGQGTISRNRCKACGKAVLQCPYKGKHPKQEPATKPKTTPQPKPATKKGKHPKQEPATKPKTTPQPKPEPTPAPRVSASYQNQVLRVGNVSYRMIPVSGGTFTMGATSEMTEPWDDEKPTHQVTLSSYYIGETEVTQALWKAVMGSNPSEFKGDNLPVEKVSWHDCQTFISKLNGLTGRHFRLPTEAEWEFAARGGNGSRHTQYSGSSRIEDMAWYDGNSGSKTHPVKTKQPNELGIYDMSGNVWEWCQDRFGSYNSSAQTNPTGASSGSRRVYRGGSWYYDPRYCRSSCRGCNAPDFEFNDLGLRLVLSE